MATEARGATGDDGEHDVAAGELCCAQEFRVRLEALQADDPPQLPTSPAAIAEPAIKDVSARRSPDATTSQNRGESPSNSPGLSNGFALQLRPFNPATPQHNATTSGGSKIDAKPLPPLTTIAQ